MLVAALAAEAGLPDGVLNIVHGNHVSICVQKEDILTSPNLEQCWSFLSSFICLQWLQL